MEGCWATERGGGGGEGILLVVLMLLAHPSSHRLEVCVLLQ